MSSIGDIVLTSPIIRCVKNQLKSEVHFLTKKSFASLLEHNPSIDRLWCLDQAEADLIAALKEEKFDLILDLHKSIKSRKLGKSLGVKTISFDKINIRKWLYVNFKTPALPKVHLVDRYFQSFEEIGIRNDGLGLDFHLNPNKDSSELGLPSEFISIALGAAHQTKQIPLEIMEQICGSIDFPILLLGGKEDVTKGRKLAEVYPHVSNRAGEWSLGESAIALSKTRLLITGDTGLMHIATGLKRPTAVLWGNTVPEFGMYPYYGAQAVPTSDHQVPDLSCRPCSKLGKKVCPKGHFKCMLGQDLPRLVEKIRTFI